MSAHDVLIGATPRPLSLPVYCVEEGRWARESRGFASAGTAGTKKLRRSAVKKYRQGKVWADVREKSGEAGVRSSTGTMQAVYRNPRLRGEIQRYVKAFEDLPRKVENMVGFVAVVHGRLSSADVFVNPRLFTDLWMKLLRATAVDVVTHKAPAGDHAGLDEVRAFLQAGFDGEVREIDTPGLGSEYLIEGRNGVSGSALTSGASLIHLALFSEEKGDRPRELRPDLKVRKKTRKRLPGKKVRVPPADTGSPESTKGREGKKRSKRRWRKRGGK
jgi:hypothetical protein